MVLQNTCCLIWLDAIECSPSPTPSPMPQVCCTQQGVCKEDLNDPTLRVGVGWDWDNWVQIYEYGCNACRPYLCTAAPGILYGVNDCSECTNPFGAPTFCTTDGGPYGPCGTLVDGPCVPASPVDLCP